MKKGGQEWKWRQRLILILGGRCTALLIIGLFLIYFLGRYDLSSKRAARPSVVKHQPKVAVYDGSHRPILQTQSIVQHGHIFEVKGRTELGATVMINRERVAVVFDGSSFRHFVGSLPTGLTIITVTAQDDEGGVNTQRLGVTIE